MPRSILIVDDDPVNIRTFNEILIENHSSDYEVVNANNGLLALKIAKATLPDVIITDWEMPEMNGIELIKALKKDETTRDIPVIMASGIMLTSNDLTIALGAGAADYIRKPVDQVELQARLRSAIETADYVKELRIKNDIILKQEKELMQKNIDQLQNDLNYKQKELSANLGFLMQIEKERENFGEDLNKLRPYLNPEGKRQLEIVIQQINGTDNKQSLLELENRFSEINQRFYDVLREKVPDITKTEQLFSAYSLLNLSPAEIAVATRKNLNAINVAFSRLRSKFGVNSNVELKEAIHALNRV